MLNSQEAKLKLEVRVKRLHKDAVIPAYAKEGDAGLDLTAVSKSTTGDNFGGYTEYGTGLSFEIPQGFVGLLFPRSSITSKAMLLKNSVGVVDSGYRGEVKLRFIADEDSENIYNVGDRVAQIIILPHPHVELIESDELSDTVRGEGGYGSTGS